MKRSVVISAVCGALLLLASALAIRRVEFPHEDFVVRSRGCSTPVTMIAAPGTARGSAIVLHGLSANRRVMITLGERLAAEASLRIYLLDLAGHGDNADPFSFPRAEECAAATVEQLVRDQHLDPTRLALVGHSMGGAIAIRLADRFPVAATIAISPAPMTLPKRAPANLLVFSAQYDLWPLQRQAEAIADAAGPDRTTTVDFRQLRAFHLEFVPRASHTSIVIDSRVARQAANWVEDSLEQARIREGTGGWTDEAPQSESLATLLASIAPFGGMVALLMMFPFALALTVRGGGSLQPEQSGARSAAWLALAEGAVGSLAGVLLLRVGIPLKALRIYSGGYLASLLLIVGLLLLVFNRRAANEAWKWRASKALQAAMLGFAVMLAAGAWLNWRTADLWLGGARWERFAAILPVSFLFAFGEETILGPVGNGRRRAARFVVAQLVRLELWLACLLAFYVLANGQAVIAILFMALTTFSVLQRLGTDAIRHHTGSATAAAVFGAILTAWFIAAVFPLT